MVNFSNLLVYRIKTFIYIIWFIIYMSYKQVKIRISTDKMIDSCEESFRFHHPEFDHMKISRDKIVYEMAKFYLSIK